MNHTPQEKPMDSETMQAAIEAQFLMGHWVPTAYRALERSSITDWSWDMGQVRQQLHVPANALWAERVLALEAPGLVTFTLYDAPITHDAQGNEHERPGCRNDAPRAAWGLGSIHARGVLRLAELYGRPYVRCEESPAVLAHWHLVQAESAACLHTPDDPAQWAREWPKQALLWKAREAACRRQWEEEDADA